MYSCRHAILCMLLIAGVTVGGHAQSSSSKEPAASISGKVTVQGEGVPGVVITLRADENPGSRGLTNHRGVTDAKGEYRIANVPPGKYAVIPASAAFVGEDERNRERTLLIDKAETIEDVDFSLIRGGVITGRVVDSDGQPMIEEEVHVYSARDPRLKASQPGLTTDDRGVYRVFGLRPGTYTVAAGAEHIGRAQGRSRGGIYGRTYYPGVNDPAQATVIQVSDGSEATNIDIVLGRALSTHTASGRVVNGVTGQAMPNLGYGVIHFVSPTYTASMSLGSVTNDRGEFKLENLIPGHYAVTVRPEEGQDWRAEEVRFEIVDQDVTGLVVRTLKGGTVSGVVVLDGIADKAIREQLNKARVIVSIVPERTQRSLNPAFTSTVGVDGRFRVTGLPTGNARFSLAASRHFRIIRVERDGIIQSRGIDVKQGEDITGVRMVVGYADAFVRGIVQVENGAIPPKGQILLRARKLNDPAVDASRTYIPAQVDARGQFVFEYMFPGTYELIAGVFVPGSREPIAETKQEIVVTAGSTINTTMKLNLNPPQPQP